MGGGGGRAGAITRAELAGLGTRQLDAPGPTRCACAFHYRPPGLRLNSPLPIRGWAHQSVWRLIGNLFPSIAADADDVVVPHEDLSDIA